MKVKEVLEWAGIELGINDSVQTYLGGGSSDVGKLETERLLTAYNLVENELALDYFALLAKETFENADGAIAFTAFANDPVQVLSVESVEKGEDVAFSIYIDHLEVEGKVVVAYRYAPKTKDVEDDCEIAERVTKHMLVFGVVANYLASVGEYGQASAWEKKYKSAIVLAQGISKSKRIASRSWV